MAWTPMVLFRGSYSNALQPDEHYIALEKDFSNLDEVLARLADLLALEAMTQRAFDHLVGSGQFTYRAFYGRVSAAIELKLAQLSRVRSELKNATTQVLWSADVPDRLLELPTPWPCGPDGFKIRQEVAEAALYRREFDRLIGEFARLRSAFVPEIDRIRLSYQWTLGLFGQSAQEMLLPPAAAASDNSFAGLLAAYDDEIETASAQRISARENFSAALSRNAEQDSGRMLRSMLAIERDGYFNLIEWIRRLNESYQAERVELDRQYRERMRWLVARVLPQLPLKQQLKVRYILLKMRLRRLSSVVLRGVVHSPLARKIAAVPALGPLTRRVATREQLSGAASVVGRIRKRRNDARVLQADRIADVEHVFRNRLADDLFARQGLCGEGAVSRDGIFRRVDHSHAARFIMAQVDTDDRAVRRAGAVAPLADQD
ncbi:MAG: hypothetical protein EOO23_07590, partial [Comamonadaceae bacterium]